LRGVNLTEPDTHQLANSALVKVAERGEERVLMKNNKPFAAVVGIEKLERTEALEERRPGVSLALARLLTTSERRHSLDDVLDRFGFTREDLEKD
jgi:antitoxin (DNA-binding transcriptional repressor) of toxin-antitoxin stability system